MKKCYESLDDGDVDRSDITTVAFDIFSKRKRFNYDLKERVRLYLGFMAPVCKFLRCKSCNYDQMMRAKKIFEKAKDRLEFDCDIIQVMD